MKKKEFKIAASYQKSTRLDADLSSEIFNQLILHDSYKDLLQKIINNSEKGGQRAFTLTGPYGGGKSTFAVLLAGLLSPDKKIRSSAENLLPKPILNNFKKSFGNDNGWVVIKVVSGGENHILSLYNSLKVAIDDFWVNQKKPKEIENLQKPKNYHTLIEYFELVANVASSKKNKSGLIIIFDELGKVFENAQKNNTDLYFFQELSERFNRSNNSCFFVGILHQAFQEYAKNTTQTIRDEWAKIQGRFTDLPFSLGIEEVIKLINNAISGPPPPQSQKKKEMCFKVIDSLNDSRLKTVKKLDLELLGCWPLHPMTSLLLGPISRRKFGQNERSTFGFLTSLEPYGFKDFIENYMKETESYSPDMLWDYLKHNLEPTIMVSPDGHKWAEASESIKRVEDKNEDTHVKILKVISIIDLFGKPYGLVANEKIISLIFEKNNKIEIRKILDDLLKWSSVVYKKHLDTYAIFAGSDIDLEKEMKLIEESIDKKTSNYLNNIDLNECVIAKRHYHEKGTLRWLDKRIYTYKELIENKEKWQSNKGEISSFILCADKIEDPKYFIDTDLVIGTTKNIAELKSIALELKILYQAKEEILELSGDAVARKELNSRIDEANSMLESLTKECFESATWLYKNEKQKNKNLSHIASIVADKIYSKSPIIKSEIINKEKPSSNAIGAQKKLMYAIAANPLNPNEEIKYNNEKENLGIEKHPAELGLYLTLLNSEKIHIFDKKLGIWKFSKPTRGSLLSMWKVGESFLQSCDKTSKPLSDLYEIWKAPPFGLKEGVLPIYAMTFMLVNEDKAGFYLDGIYKPNLNEVFVERLSHSPKNIMIRFFDSKGIHKNTLKLYSKLTSAVLKIDAEEDALKVAKPIAKFGANLPEYTKLTKTLSARTVNIRNVILRASDPIKLIEDDLKKACGLKNSDKVNDEMMRNLANSLKELQSCYDNLIEDLKSEFFNEFNLKGSEKKKTEELGKRSKEIKESNVNSDFKFEGIISILSEATCENDWIELCASKLVHKRPKVWSDSDAKNFYVELHEFARQFTRIEDYAKAKILKNKLNPQEKKKVESLKAGIEALLEDNNQKLQEKALLDLLEKLRN